MFSYFTDCYKIFHVSFKLNFTEGCLSCSTQNSELIISDNIGNIFIKDHVKRKRPSVKLKV